MNRVFIAIFALIFTACQPVQEAQSTFETDTQAYEVALKNFVYEKEAEGLDVAKINKRYDRPNYGDCEDFAFTLQKAIGGTVWSLVLRDGTGHAVLVKDEWVFDSIQISPVRVNEYHKKYGRFRWPRVFDKISNY